MKNNKQTGVALVTVLLVAAVTIALAYGALTISLNSLRSSKAAESSVQARLNAESGLDATFVYLEERFRANEDFKIFSHIPAITTENSATMEQGKTYAFPTDPERLSVDDTFHIALDGYTSDGSTYQTNADVYYNPGGGDYTEEIRNPGSIYTQLYRGITTCSGIDLSGGSGNVVGGTLFSQGNVQLRGGTLISSDIYIDGDLDTSGSSSIKGDLYITGMTTIGSGSAAVFNNIYSLGDVIFNNDPRVTSVSANGTIDFGGKRVTLEKHARAGGAILNHNAVIVGGSSSTTPEFTPHIVPSPVSFSFDACKNNVLDDNVGVSELLNSLPPRSSSLVELNSNWSNGLLDWEITPNSVINSDVSYVKPNQNIFQSGVFFGDRLDVIRLKSIETVNGTKITIRGNVIIFVDGDVKLGTGDIFDFDTGGPTEANNSLTIITPGQITVSTNSQNSNWSAVKSDKSSPTLTLITSFPNNSATPGSTNYGVTLTGGTATFNGLIYAPNSPIRIEANTLHGAVVGNGFSYSGSGTISYDPRLAELIEDSLPGNDGEEGLVIVKRR